MSLLFDTNIFIYIAKDLGSQQVRKIINPDNQKAFVSVASVAELKSMALKNNWGARKLQAIDKILDE